MKRRIVVTGWGLVSSLSCEVEDCWNRILGGESGVHAIRLIETEDLKVKIGGDVYDWDGSQYLDPKVCKKVDRFSQFAMVAANQAVTSSGIDFTTGDNLRYGCLLGSGIGGLITISEQMERLILKGPSRVSPLTIPKLMLNAGGGNIAIEHGLRGPNYSVATACASAGNAMGDALSLIGSGDCDVLITGGSECALTRIGVSAFQNMRALSLRNDDPGAASRPFDRGRDGFVLSEGAGILIFEELEHAKARQADILGEVIGFGTTCDAGHITSPDPTGTGAARAMSLALQDAGIAPEQVDYINAHGTSTPLGDVAETIAMKNVFGEHAYRVSISSTKSQIGHSLGASGGLELIFSLKAILNNLVPPTINLDDPDPDCDLDYTPNQPKEREIKIAMSNSFGFGGHNASVIIKEFCD
ncbi:MAG: beta-ketoacyl-ACP synthase II [Planctomycetota bacterium]|nr:beta-ketoacyl-ACP synthase II [Planctomycetota bacterium]